MAVTDGGAGPQTYMPASAPVRACVFAIAAATGCAPVTQIQRQHLADPTMQVAIDPLEGAAQRKLLVSREGAAGGDAKAAGGGCSCGN
jgi:hypothetical protein